MILICDDCHARYLVPATHFAGGARRVRCAKCGKEWMATLPAEKKPDIVLEEAAPAALEKAEAGRDQTEETQQKQTPAETAKQTEKFKTPVLKVAGFVEPPTSTPPIPEGSGLPAIWQDPFWSKVGAVLSVFGLLVIMIIALWCVVDRYRIVHLFPQTEPVYALLHLPIEHAGDGLELVNIVSEREGEQGAVQIVVNGEIKNTKKRTQKIPLLLLTAVKADGTVLKTWTCKPEVPEIAGGAVLSFKSVEAIGDEPVAEVTLTFQGTGPVDDEEDAD